MLAFFRISSMSSLQLDMSMDAKNIYQVKNPKQIKSKANWDEQCCCDSVVCFNPNFLLHINK